MLCLLTRARRLGPEYRRTDVKCFVRLCVQRSVNLAAQSLGVVWDERSDMRFEHSMGYGKGTITGLGDTNCTRDIVNARDVVRRPCSMVENSTEKGEGGEATGRAGGHEPFTIALLPHKTYTRKCSNLSNFDQTTVAHCHFPEVGSKKTWMEKADLWSIDDSPCTTGCV